jgi:two-component system, NarL family, nitrate/nitrite response regulator NarL
MSKKPTNHSAARFKLGTHALTDPDWIIVAEDHALVRELIVEWLSDLIAEKNSTTITQVADYRELMKLSGAGRVPTLIILDINMPGADGISGVKDVVNAFAASRVLILSGSSDSQTARTCIQLGCKGFLPKTAPSKTLLQAVRMVLDGEIYVHPYLLSGLIDGPTPSNEAFTPRERDVVEELLKGKSNKEIARAAYLKEMTVKAHLRNIFRKLGAVSRSDAVGKILRARGLTIN